MFTKPSIVFFILILTLCSFAKRPELFIVRYKDNNKAIKADSSDWKFHRIIKEIPLSKKNDNSHISFGGELRLQYYNIQTGNFGDVRPGTYADESFLEQRYMLHSDFQISPYFRGFAQLTSNHNAGDKNIRPQIDLNDLDLMQLFGEIRFPTKVKLSLRLGRQAISYGYTARMIGIREGPSVRKAYDGVTLLFNSKKFSTDIFAYAPVLINDGIFDDTTSREEYHYGTYLKLKLQRRSAIELYYFGSHRDNAFYVDQSNSENRHSIGTRGYHNTRNYKLSLESTYQFGRFGDDTISAFQVDFQGEYSLNQFALNPTFLLQADIQSGDKNSKDGRINTFRSIGAKPIGDSPFSFGSSNIYAIKPEFEITILKKLRLKTTYLSVWRFSDEDFIYTTSMSRVARQPRGRNSSTSHFYANAVMGELRYKLNKHFTFTTCGGAVFPQSFAKETGNGKTSTSFQMKFRYRF